MGGLGNMEYDFTFTKVFGHLPYPLLITPPGNMSLFYSGRTYNRMNPGEFISDEALELYASWHMNGLILNKIPLIKKLQWRTVISAHVAFGALSDKNNYYDSFLNPSGILYRQPVAVPPSDFRTLSYNRPYAELSYGIENIFRFLRVDLVQRLTYLEDPAIRPFGLKVSGVFRF
jgi:hypothetical protein